MMRALLRRLEESERFTVEAMTEMLTAIVKRAKVGGYYRRKFEKVEAQKAYNEGWKLVREALSALGRAGQENAVGTSDDLIREALRMLYRSDSAFFKAWARIDSRNTDIGDDADSVVIRGIRNELDAIQKTASLTLGPFRL